MVMDLGSARKEITLSWVIYEQEITKFKGGDSASPKKVKLTSYEIAQLIHSYVDSSFIHEDQNISKLILLIPSRADNNFEYRSSTADPPTASQVITADTPLEDLPLIPFHFANRSYDVSSWSYGHTKKTFDYFQNTADEIEGIRGFVQNFSTELSGADSPHIQFSLTFIQSSTLVSDFINTSMWGTKMPGVFIGDTKSLVFPVMCDGYLQMKYSDKNSSTSTNVDLRQGIWGHNGSFTIEAIITPYDVNGYGSRGSTSAGVTTSEKTPPSVNIDNSNLAHLALRGMMSWCEK